MSANLNQTPPTLSLTKGTRWASLVAVLRLAQHERNWEIGR